MGWNDNVSKGKKKSRQASGMYEKITRNEGKWSWGRLWNTARGSKSMPWLCCGPQFGLLEWRGQLGKEEMTLLFSNHRECGMGQELPSSSNPFLPSFFHLSLFSFICLLSLYLFLIIFQMGYVSYCLCPKGNEPKYHGELIMWETESPRSAAGML